MDHRKLENYAVIPLCFLIGFAVVSFVVGGITSSSHFAVAETILKVGSLASRLILPYLLLAILVVGVYREYREWKAKKV